MALTFQEKVKSQRWLENTQGVSDGWQQWCGKGGAWGPVCILCVQAKALYQKQGWEAMVQQCEGVIQSNTQKIASIEADLGKEGVILKNLQKQGECNLCEL